MQLAHGAFLDALVDARQQAVFHQPVGHPAAEHDEVGVEQVDRVGEPDDQGVNRVIQHSPSQRVALGCGGEHRLGIHRCRRSQGGTGIVAVGQQVPGVPGDAGPRGQRLQAALIAAGAPRGGVADVDRSVAHFYRQPIGAQVNQVAVHQAAADAGADRDVEQGLDWPALLGGVFAGPEVVLAKRGEVGVVPHPYGTGELLPPNGL